MPRIRHLKVEAVASVDRPANQKPFVLIKRADAEEGDSMPRKTKKNDPDAALAFDVREHVDVMKALGQEEHYSEEALEAFAKQVSDAAAAFAKERADAAAEAARAEARKDAGKEPEGDDELNKAELPEAVRKRMDEQDRVIKEMQERERRAVMLAKAQTLPALGGDVEERAELLKGLYEGDADALAKLEQRLQTLQQEREQSDLFRSAGHPGGGDEADPVDAAARRLQKSQEGLTYEQAYAKALEQDPSLYDRALRG